ncbi:MAG: hypothetical protein OHK0024_02240 [Thalassobaculales bacterium]
MEKSDYLRGAPKIGEGAGRGRFLDSFSAQRLDPKNPAAFRERILSFCRQDRALAEALIAGNVQMIGFADAKPQFGEHWPRVRDKILLLTESVIRQHAGPRDVYVQVSEDQFIVLFGESDREKADTVARTIANEVNAKLTGATGVRDDLVSARGLSLELPPGGLPESIASVEGLAATVNGAQQAAEQAERKAAAAAQAVMTVRWWPVANMRKRIVSTYQARLENVPPNPSGGQGTGLYDAELDAFALKHAADALISAGGRKWKGLFLVPIHFETLAGKECRAIYMDVCRLLPRISSRRLLLEIVDLPDGVPQGRLHTLLSYAGPFFGGFVARVRIDFRAMERFTGLRMLGVGIEGKRLLQPTKPVVEALAGFAQAIRKKGTRSYFLNASTFEIATTAKRAGFDYVQGVAVAPPMAEPGRVFVLR